jgi:hypothetical protein
MSFQSFHSGGISIKNVLTKEEEEDDDRVITDENSCCYGLCIKAPANTCSGKMRCGSFINKQHSIFCGFFSLMCTALFIAVIVPLVRDIHACLSAFCLFPKCSSFIMNIASI